MLTQNYSEVFATSFFFLSLPFAIAQFAVHLALLPQLRKEGILLWFARPPRPTREAADGALPVVAAARVASASADDAMAAAADGTDDGEGAAAAAPLRVAPALRVGRLPSIVESSAELTYQRTATPIRIQREWLQARLDAKSECTDPSTRTDPSSRNDDGDEAIHIDARSVRVSRPSLTRSVDGASSMATAEGGAATRAAGGSGGEANAGPTSPCRISYSRPRLEGQVSSAFLRV